MNLSRLVRIFNTGDESNPDRPIKRPRRKFPKRKPPKIRRPK
jgi:hypothetical protein